MFCQLTGIKETKQTHHPKEASEDMGFDQELLSLSQGAQPLSSPDKVAILVNGIEVKVSGKNSEKLDVVAGAPLKKERTGWLTRARLRVKRILLRLFRRKGTIKQEIQRHFHQELNNEAGGIAAIVEDVEEPIDTIHQYHENVLDQEYRKMLEQLEEMGDSCDVDD